MIGVLWGIGGGDDDDEFFDKYTCSVVNKYLRTEGYKQLELKSLGQSEVFVWKTETSIHESLIKEYLIAGIKNRLKAGDHCDELNAQFEQNAANFASSKHSEFVYFERVAAISGMTVIKYGYNRIDLVETSELYATSQLDPLGAEDPQAALLKAYEEHKSHLVVGKTLLQNVSEKLSGLGHSFASFFARPPKEQALSQGDLPLEEVMKVDM